MRWVARFRTVDNGLATEENIPLHVCSDEEIASFDEPLSAETADLVDKIQAGGHFYCFDWKKSQREIYGYWYNRDNYAYVQIELLACGSVEQNDPDSCIYDQKMVLDYFTRDWDMIVYHNHREFHPGKYGDDRVSKGSTLTMSRTVY